MVPRKPPPPVLPTRDLYQALYDYQINDSAEGELSFCQDEIFEILEKSDGDWWMAKSLTTLRSGYIPTNFVQKYQAPVIEPPKV
jgi:SH3 domain